MFFVYIYIYIYIYFIFFPGVILDSQVFDTHGDSSAGNNLGKYLNNTKGKYVILVQVYSVVL